MHLKPKKCPVCDSINFHLWNNDLRYMECDLCKSIWLLSSDKSAYNKEYYDRGNKSWLMRIVDSFSFWDRYLTLGLSRSDRILEIGFGEGKFLKELKAKKYSMSGVEGSDYARKRMEKLLGENKVFDDIERVSEKCDLIVMYHVLEHIEDPKAYIKSLMKVLSPGGRLVVRVPNIDSVEAKLAGKNWYHLDYPNHQVIFSEAGLVKMFEDGGYKNIQSRNFFGEYRQVLGYSILSKLGVRLGKPLMILFQLTTIPILWIFSVLVAQHGVVEVEGKVGNSSNST